MFAVLFIALSLAISRCEVDTDWGKRRSDLADDVIAFCSIFSLDFDIRPLFRPLGSWWDQLNLQSSIHFLFTPLNLQVALMRANPVLQITIMQLPHLYFIIRIRLTKEPLLSSGNDESQWGFGEIYALIMSAVLVIECCKGYLSTCIYLISCRNQLMQVA